MPIFERQCNECGRIEEEIILSNADNKDDEKKLKIKCGKDGCDGIMQKIEISKSSFQLKGSGWFKTGGY